METIASVVVGEFVPRKRKCVECGYIDNTPKEKKTDVNIAVQMVVDAVLGLFDEAFLVTADLDLLPAVQTVVDERLYEALDRSNRKPPSVTVLFPPGSRYSQEFLNYEDEHLDKVRCIELSTANIVRFPEELAQQLGYEFPEHWRLGSSGPPPR